MPQIDVVYKNKGKIILLLGPMFAGKTTELIRLYNIYKRITPGITVFSYVKDNRYTDEQKVVTHNQNEMPCIKIDSFTTKQDNLIKDCKYIFIDEVQFIQNFFEYTTKWANQGKIIVCSMLSGSFKREPFSNDCSRLISNADKIKHLRSICYKCFESAPFSIRLSNEEELEVIGQENYKAVCRECYNEFNNLI